MKRFFTNFILIAFTIGLLPVHAKFDLVLKSGGPVELSEENPIFLDEFTLVGTPTRKQRKKLEKGQTLLVKTKVNASKLGRRNGLIVIPSEGEIAVALDDEGVMRISEQPVVIFLEQEEN